MHMEFPFFYSDIAYTGTKQVTIDQAKRMNEAVKALKLFKKPLPTSVTKIVKMLISQLFHHSLFNFMRQPTP